MFLKKLGKRGVAMTEYAILLAFVAAVAGSFTSDNGLASSITAAIGKAENAINMAMGKSNTSPINRAPLKGEYADELQAGVNALVDGIYDAYKRQGYSLRTLKVNSKGNPTEITYWNQDSSYSVLAKEDYIQGNYNDFLEGTGCTFAKDGINGNNTTQIFFDANGNLVMPHGYGERNQLTGGMQPRIVLAKDGHQYCIETFLWGDAVVNKDNPDTYLGITQRY